MMSLEITKVANGYMVRGAYDVSMGRNGEMHVFETFDAMVEYLRKQMDPISALGPLAHAVRT